MAGVAMGESGAGRSFEGLSGGQQTHQQCQSGEALAEWRSLEQVENGSPSTSPPHWDSDDDDDDGGPKPSDLYGKYTWKIDKFSQINKRELRSNAFEVGGYKWYILIYPQGCDVCNHLSLFLCVANHDKLLPGWSHFAQFTIAVVNKDPKKSKYSDTLHRFWKKEHDWGWKKFMELSKVLDGFIDADTLIIKAQVQVIRERADRPFRCLDCHYRRELVRVYLTNVEQICRRFVEERRGKLGKLIDDKDRWSSLCSFWRGMDRSSRVRMCREKKESILKFIVKHFFIEKEVTSTLVMDSLYSGLKALERHNIGMEVKELPFPIVHTQEDMFVFGDDVLLMLLEKAATEPLPPKDEKGPQNRTKDGTAGEEFNKDSIERDERRLTELGRRTIEIFVLSHIFGKVEVSYQEAVSLKKQEELIREEAAWLAETEQKARRGAVDKEKKSKKKQGKQKRNHRKGKDKGKDDRANSTVQDKTEHEDSPTAHRIELPTEHETVFEKSEVVEDVSDVSDSVDCVPETLPPDSEDTDSSEVLPHTETSSTGLSGVQNRVEQRSASVVDDSSSTCSSDSVPSVVTCVPPKGYYKSQKSQTRAKNYQRELTSDAVDWVNEELSQSSEAVVDAKHPSGASPSSKTIGSLSHTAVKSLQDRVVLNGTEQQVGKKEEETNSFHRGSSTKNGADVAVSGNRAACLASAPKSPSKPIPLIASLKLDSKINKAASDPVMITKPSSDSSPKIIENSAENGAISRPDPLKFATTKPADDKPAISPPMSRPSSAPVVPGPRPSFSMVSMVQTAPTLSRSVGTVGRLDPKPTTTFNTASPSYVPQSYRSAIIGNSSAYSSQDHSSTSYSQASAPVFSQHVSDRTDPNLVNPGISFGMVNHHQHQHQHHQQQQHDNVLHWMNLLGDHGSVPSEMQSFDMYRPMESRSMDHQLTSEFPAGTSGREVHQLLPDEFPHLDIINDLLDDGIDNSNGYLGFTNGPVNLNRHYSFPADPPGMSSYHRGDGFQHGYGSSGARTYDSTTRDMIPQASQQPHVNGRIDGFIPNQWPNPGSDLPYFNVRNMDNDGYHYRTPEYNPNINGYTVFRPPNGY